MTDGPESPPSHPVPTTAAATVPSAPAPAPAARVAEVRASRLEEQLLGRRQFCISHCPPMKHGASLMDMADTSVVWPTKKDGK